MIESAPIHVLAAGPFGQDVAQRLQELSPCSLALSGPESVRARWPVARARILCSWRSIPRLEERLDEAAFDWPTPWLPVVLEGLAIRVGPLIIPGRGPCLRCYRRRIRQHGRSPLLLDAIEQHLDGHPEAGLRGHLPPHARAAAALALRLLAEGASAAGALAVFSLSPVRIQRDQVLGVDGCARCDTGGQQPAARQARLRRDIRELLERAACV